MRRWLMILAVVLVGTVALTGCGSDESPTTSPASALSDSSTTSAAATAAASSTGVSSSSTTAGALEAYKLQMKEWRDKHEARMTTATQSLDALDNPLLASDEDIKGLKDLVDVLDDVAGDLKDIKPPAELSTAHADYLATFTATAQAFGQLAEALEDKSLEAVMAVMTAMEGVTEKGTAARDTLEKALGFPLSGEGAEQAAVGGGELGTRGNPIPMGQEMQVGDWKITVTGADLNATFDGDVMYEPLEPGNQYVRVELSATRTGEEPMWFDTDTICQFVGSGGNTFAYIPMMGAGDISAAGEVFAPATITGILVFQGPSGQVAGGTLSVEELSLDGDRVFFAVQ